MITSKHASVIVLAGLLGVVATQQGCGSDTSGPSESTTAGSSGAPAGTAGSGVAGSGTAGAPSSTAGAPGTAGAPSSVAGAPGTAGSGTGGASTAGAGGTSSAGAGGTAGGGTAGGGTAGGGTAGGGGASTTFAAVKALFGTSCGVGDCHNAKSGNLDYQGTTDLHGLLTKPIASGIAHCVGTTLVKATDTATSSFLVTTVKAGGNCPTGGGNIGRMPDDCGKAGKGACLTDAQVKVITDWITAGAPN